MVSPGYEIEGAATAIPAPAEARAAMSLVPDNLAAFALRAAGARAATRTLGLQACNTTCGTRT